MIKLFRTIEWAGEFHQYRSRFAWKPVQIWEIRDGFAFNTRKTVWLSRVVEVKTFFDGWRAYKRHQR